MNVDDVFGVSREIPENYVERRRVDDEFVNRLARDQHIVIYGSSKQGKTSLRKKWLNDDDYIVVSSSNKWRIADLHASILKEAGFATRVSSTKTLSGQAKLAISATGKAGLPLIGRGEVSGEAEGAGSIEKSETRQELEIDPSDANDIIRALTEIEFKTFIVIEDFHYLPEETQRDFSFALKTFHKKSKLSFIIVGVWREENRLIGYNGDLTERVYSIDVDTWHPDSLKEVIIKGGNLMNVEFTENFVEDLLENCFDSVHLVQEACRRACRNSDIYATAKEKTVIGDNVSAVELVREIVNDQKGRYMGFLFSVSEGFQTTEKEMPKWVIYAILKSTIEDLTKGVRLREISRIIKLKHPDGDRLNAGNWTQILKTIGSL